MIKVKGGLDEAESSLAGDCMCACEHGTFATGFDAGLDCGSCACQCPPIQAQWDYTNGWVFVN